MLVIKYTMEFMVMVCPSLDKLTENVFLFSGLRLICLVSPSKISFSTLLADALLESGFSMVKKSACSAIFSLLQSQTRTQGHSTCVSFQDFVLADSITASQTRCVCNASLKVGAQGLFSPTAFKKSAA